MAAQPLHAAVTAVAQYLIYLAIMAAVVAWLTLPAENRTRLAIQAAVAAVVTLALAEVAGHIYYDPRPFVTAHVRPYFFHPANNGFPSDHTAAVALLGLLLWSYRRPLSVVLLAVALLIGIARVMARVHSPLDVVAGVCIAILGAVAGLAVGKLVYRRRDPRQPPDGC